MHRGGVVGWDRPSLWHLKMQRKILDLSMQKLEYMRMIYTHFLPLHFSTNHTQYHSSQLITRNHVYQPVSNFSQPCISLVRQDSIKIPILVNLFQLRVVFSSNLSTFLKLLGLPHHARSFLPRRDGKVRCAGHPRQPARLPTASLFVVTSWSKEV